MGALLLSRLLQRKRSPTTPGAGRTRQQHPHDGLTGMQNVRVIEARTKVPGSLSQAGDSRVRVLGKWSLRGYSMKQKRLSHIHNVEMLRL